MNEDIVIKDVDPKLLDKQRVSLHLVVHAATVGRQASREEIKDAHGILNMLDAWSDEREQS